MVVHKTFLCAKMLMHKESYEVEIGGKKLIAEFSDLADQAHGSVIMRYGNTTVLATAVMSAKKRDGGGDFFPLTVDFEERFYAAGQILGSRFMRREGRPSDAAVLSGRIIDRTIRPLFDQRIRYDVQVVITVLSIDKDEPDVLAVNAASLALATSDIPFGGPVSAIRVARQGGRWITLPPFRVEEGQDIIEGDCELVVCGKNGNVKMIEMGGKEVGGMDEKRAERCFDDMVNDLLHKKAINENRRPDGRNFDEVRPLFAEAGGLSPVLHGTGIFYRGGTHVLSALT